MSRSHLLTMRLLPPVAALAVMAMAAVASGCKDDKPVGTADVDTEAFPTMLTRDVETLISDSGVVRYQINTPLWYVFDDVSDPYWKFPDGLSLIKFDDFFRTEATVRADSARYFKAKQLWKLDGAVSITNVLGEKFLTEQLYWDQRGHKLYSDSFIHIERADKVLEGHGFDSNEQLTRYTIRRVAGIFPAAQFRPGQRQGAPEADNEAEADDADEQATDSATTLKSAK